MLSERNYIDLFRKEIKNCIEEKRVPKETLPSNVWTQKSEFYQKLARKYLSPLPSSA